MNEWLKSLGLPSDIVPLLTTYAVRIASVLLILLAALFIGNMVRSWVERGLARIRFDATLSKFLATVSRWMVLLVAALGCLEMFGIKTTSFAAVLGGASLAVGLAFQGSLSNVAAGIMLLVFRPFKVGDVVTVGGQTGGVEEIGLFTTHLNTPQNVHIIMPNGKIFGDTIVNLTRNPYRRVDVNVGVEYSADLRATREALERAAAKVSSQYADVPPAVFLSSLGDSAVNWQVRVFTTNEKYWAVHEETVQAVKESLDAAGLGIPFPQVVVHKAE